MPDQTKNVAISIQDRFNTQLAAVSSINWQGVDFDSSAATEWLEPRLLGFASRVVRLTEREEVWTLSVNCYAKTGEGGETIYRVWELADQVLTAFAQITMAVLDWATSGNPVIAQLRFNEGVVTPIPAQGSRPVESPELQQVNVTLEGMLIT